MQKISIWLLSLALNTSLFAGVKPIELKFEEGEQLVISLSKLNFNRLFVAGERIVKVRYPEHSFLVDKSESQEDKDGSVYLKPLTNLELTVFFTTDENHHFSLNIKPEVESSKTLKLLRKGASSVVFAEVKEKQRYKAEDAMSLLMEGKTPTGFREVKVNPKSFYVHQNLRLTLLKQCRGENQSGYVYLIENKAKESIALKPELFENPKLLSLELSAERLKPGQKAYLYGFYSEASNLG